MNLRIFLSAKTRGLLGTCYCLLFSSFLSFAERIPSACPTIRFWKHITFTFISSQLESNFPRDESYLHIWLRWYLDETLKSMMERLRLWGYWDRVNLICIWEGHVGGCSRLRCYGLNICVPCLSNFVCWSLIPEMMALWDRAIWEKAVSWI